MGEAFCERSSFFGLPPEWLFHFKLFRLKIYFARGGSLLRPNLMFLTFFEKNERIFRGSKLLARSFKKCPAENYISMDLATFFRRLAKSGNGETDKLDFSEIRLGMKARESGRKTCKKSLKDWIERRTLKINAC